MSFRIIYVDDEKDLLEFFAEDFAHPAVEIQTFSDPKAAVDAIRKSPPQLVFIDFQLPGTTGEKLAREIDGKIPKILLSGNLELEFMPDFIKVLPKPWVVEEVKALIEAEMRKLT